MTLLLLLACDESTAPPPEAALQAARGAPAATEPWTGPWTVTLWAKDERDVELKGLAEGLGVAPRQWRGGFPKPAPGEVAVVWYTGENLGKKLAHGEQVFVIAPGTDPGVATTLAWERVGVMDASAELGLWVDPSSAGAGRNVARVIADHYDLPYHPGGAWPPGLDAWLGTPDPAHLSAADPRTRAEAARLASSSADALASDPEVAVRLAVAASTQDAAVRARLAADPEPLVRARAADALADVSLLDTLLDDPSSVVRVVAAHRLARIGGPTVQAALLRAAASPDAYVRWKAASGLDDRATLERLLADVDIDVRREAARRLGMLGDAEAVPALLVALTDANSFVRRWAAEALGRLGDARALPALRVAAKDPTVLVSQAAARALTRLGEPTQDRPWAPGRPPKDDVELARRAQSPDATDRKDVTKFLSGRDDGAEWLTRLAQDPDSEVRKSAVEGLGWTKGPAAPLLAALADPDPDTVVTALDALRRRGDGTVDALAPLTRHADAELRLRAVEALAALGPSDALLALATDGDERVRAAVARAHPLPDDPAVLVRLASGVTTGDALLVHATWARGAIAREDTLLHERFSWNLPEDRPSSHKALRPPVAREYGHPDRG